MKVMSLFDGISCGQVALNRIGIRPSVYFASEIEKPAIACTQHNFPQTVQLGDVVKVREMAEAGFFGVGEIELLIGGSPCQGFSSAGNQLNFSDPRSALFFEFVRIKNAIQPKKFMLENVRMKKDWLDIISAFLGVQPILINSKDFSAQQRPRFYWTDINVKSWEDKNINVSDILDYSVNTINSIGYHNWFSKAKDFQLTKGYTRIVNSFGIEKALCLTRRYPACWNGNIFEHIPGVYRFLTAEECEKLQTLPIGYTSCMKTMRGGDMRRYEALGNGWTVDVIAHIFRGLHDARE